MTPPQADVVACSEDIHLFFFSPLLNGGKGEFL